MELRYRCDKDDCNKTFSRQDHLARHKLNHSRSQRHKCPFPGCEKMFVRTDVCKKHYKQQHEEKHVSFEEDNSNKKNELKFIMMGSPASKVPKIEQSQPEPETNSSIEELISSDELIRWIFGDIENNTTEMLTISPNESLENFPELEEFEYPFSHTITTPQELQVVDSPDDLLPNFPYSNEQVFIDVSIMEALEEVIPSVKFQENFKKDRLQEFLECYWRYYHPQFPVLNLPSFSTKTAHPILVLAMITLGSYISGTITGSSCKSVIFSDSIATPLRWAIYNSKEFKPPPKLWVVQSLLLLETYEICCSSRELHERANLHRGTSIQMLKRSPMFGGNPWSRYMNGTNDNSPTTIPPYSNREHWRAWIEEESMKRCALATFYLETLHAVVFGHDMSVDLHTVKPPLPCNELFWRTGRYTEGCLESPLTLLSAIKSILHLKPVRIRGFGKKIILSGLIALSFEVKYREFEYSIPELRSVKQLWQRKINDAFKFWDLSCSVKQLSSRFWSDTYSLPLRELYENYTQMRHYDFMVFAGAPGRMSVKFNEKETEVVKARIGVWANSVNGKRGIIFIYAYLCNSLYSDQQELYSPQEDCCIYRKQLISHMLIILWCYNFYLSGPESNNFSWNPDKPDQIPSKENAHHYLTRIKNELCALAGKQSKSEAIYEDTDTFAAVLDSVTNKQNMVGILRSFESQYSQDTSAIAREHSRLLSNCINRSLGSPNVFCGNMFE